MKVRQVMSHHPITVHTGTPLRVALRQLAASEITMLPVVDVRGRILGVVAEGDLLVAAEPSRVDQVMRHNTVLVHPETDVTEVIRVLDETGVKSLPVVDAADEVVGVVSRSDIVRLFARGDGLLQQEIIDAFCAGGIRGWRVEVHNGVVDLSGPEGEGDRASRAARDTLGVRAVRVN